MRARLLPLVVALGLAAACGGGDDDGGSTGATVDGREVNATVECSIAQAGHHPRLIQARMGHSSIVETMDTYGHLFPDSEDETRDALNSLFGATSARTARA